MRDLRPGLLQAEHSAANRRSATQTRGNLGQVRSSTEPKTKKPSDSTESTGKLDMVKTTAYLAGRPSGEARLSACSAETV
jgi:hypothetical protein